MTLDTEDRHDASTADTSWERIAANIDPRRRGVRPVWELLWLGIKAQRWGILAGLVATYLGLPIVILVACMAAIAGGFLGLVAALRLQSGAITSPYAAGVASGFDFLAVVGAAGGGAIAGALAVVGSWIANPAPVLASLIGGAVITIVTTTLIILGEQRWLRFYGYRRLSWEEKERIEPLLNGAAAALFIDLATGPKLLMSDDKKPGAWAHCTTIVLTTGELALHTDQEIAGILAHELHHWETGIGVGNQIVWAAAWPLILVLNIVTALSRHRHPIIAAFASLFVWPVLLVLLLFVVPVQGWRRRDHEYAADAAAMAAGDYYRDGMKAALIQDAPWEPGRTGWEKAVAATHPATALRIERLISPAEAARRRDVLAHGGTPRWWR